VYFKPKFLFVKSNQISLAQTIAKDNILFSLTLQLPGQGGQAYPQAIRLEDLKGAATSGGLASTKAKSRRPAFFIFPARQKILRTVSFGISKTAERPLIRLNGSRTAYLLPNLSKSQNLRFRKRIASQIKLSSKPR
jgi:hypothetical protein